MGLLPVGSSSWRTAPALLPGREPRPPFSVLTARQSESQPLRSEGPAPHAATGRDECLGGSRAALLGPAEQVEQQESCGPGAGMGHCTAHAPTMRGRPGGCLVQGLP